MKCRHCKAPLSLKMIDLGTSPPSNAYLDPDQLNMPERWYPLRVLVCEICWLVQTEDFAEREMFFSENYAYFSSFSTTWLTHVADYADMMIERFSLNPTSLVVEIASNDGCLLDAFQRRSIPVLGVEPTRSTADAARDLGIPVIEEFFSTALAQDMVGRGQRADIIVANNVLAHVPDINDFVTGFNRLAKPNGVATFEFPQLLNLIAGNQFDTIYHEHYSYLSLSSVQRILERNGLHVFDIEEIPTHGGSLRVFAQPEAQSESKDRHAQTVSVAAMLQKEKEAGLGERSTYLDTQRKAEQVKNSSLEFLIQAKRAGKTCVGYGAAAKGNTLLNFAGIRADLLEFVVDKNSAKQGRFLPGSRIPIVAEEAIRASKPDYVVILPWNVRSEIADQLAYIRDWGGQFVVFIPDTEVF